VSSDRRTRSEIVRTARALLDRGLVVATQGNVSARAGDAIYITPSALPYSTMTADDVVVLGAAGGPHPPSSEWRVHAAIYAARPDVYAIVHTHSPAATRWAHGERDLSPAVRTAVWAETGTVLLGAHAVAALGDRRAVLLARHGVVGVGASLGEALAVCEDVEELAARSQAI
jgi:L-fuculose-phosphate aldolase